MREIARCLGLPSCVASIESIEKSLLTQAKKMKIDEMGGLLTRFYELMGKEPYWDLYLNFKKLGSGSPLSHNQLEELVRDSPHMKINEDLQVKLEESLNHLQDNIAESLRDIISLGSDIVIPDFTRIVSERKSKVVIRNQARLLYRLYKVFQDANT